MSSDKSTVVFGLWGGAFLHAPLASVRELLGDLQRVPFEPQEVMLLLELGYLWASEEGQRRTSNVVHLRAGRDIPEAHLVSLILI